MGTRNTISANRTHFGRRLCGVIHSELSHSASLSPVERWSKPSTCCLDLRGLDVNCPHKLMCLNTWFPLMALFGKVLEHIRESFAGGHWLVGMGPALLPLQPLLPVYRGNVTSFLTLFHHAYRTMMDSVPSINFSSCNLLFVRHFVTAIRKTTHDIQCTNGGFRPR